MGKDNNKKKKQKDCPRCHGKGQIQTLGVKTNCSLCHGSGKEMKPAPVKDHHQRGKKRREKTNGNF